jgi:phosphatidylserine synthase
MTRKIVICSFFLPEILMVILNLILPDEKEFLTSFFIPLIYVAISSLLIYFNEDNDFVGLPISANAFLVFIMSIIGEGLSIHSGHTFGKGIVLSLFSIVIALLIVVIVFVINNTYINIKRLCLKKKNVNNSLI